MPQLFSISEVSEILGLAEHRIHYAHRSRKLDDPYCMLTGRRAYNFSDLKRVAEHFGVDVPESILEQEQEERETAGRLWLAEQRGLFTEEGQARLREMGRKLGILKN